MDYMKLDIQLFADGKVVIDTELNTKNFEQGLNKMQSTSQKAGTSIKNIVAGLGITKLIGVAMNQINSSIDGAVARVDTLNNFPKVMSNLGIASEEADKSIKKMSDKLSGLPTTLDQGAAAVQRFTSANGDVSKSTDIFLALNNAILAGGASSEIQASALEQLSQAYAKGKPDMMEWRTAMTAMPAQLKQVAEAMGYVSADELGEALRNGTVSMDDFMSTISELNTKGVNGFQSFEKQARNSTGGIGTAITVAKTQIVKGVADIITSINKGLEDADLPSISEIIAGIGKKAKEVLDLIAKNIPKIISVLKTLLPVITPIIAAFAVFKTFTIIQGIIQGITGAMAAFNAVLLANPIGLIIGLIAGLVAGFILLWNKCEAFREFWINLWNTIKEIFSPVIDSMVEMFKSAWDLIKVVWEKVKPFFELIFEGIKNAVKILADNLGIYFKTAWEVIKAVWSIVGAYFKAVFDTITGIFKAIKAVLSGDFKGAWEAIKGVFSSWGSFFKGLFNGLINIFANIGKAFLDIGKNIVSGIWNGISSSFTWIKNKITGWVGNVVKFIKKLFGIHSPSTVMRDEVGKYLAQGMGVGFDKELGNVYDDMQHAIDLETSKMTANVQTSGTYQLAMAGSPTFNLKDNSTHQTELVVNGRVLAEVVNTENRNREVAKA